MRGIKLLRHGLAVFWKVEIENLAKEHGVYAVISFENMLDLSDD
jgi:hypothetical protein